jgi:multidrug efflux pump subunit AcrA (membrane-fusion protein)
MMIGLGIVIRNKQPSAEETSAILGQVKQGDIVQRVTLIGGVQSARHLYVYPPFNGYVRKIFVKVGQRVTVGAPLISFSQVSTTPDSQVFPIRSSITGTVTQIVTTAGEYVSEKINDKNYALRVDDLADMIVECDVAETNVSKLKQGQVAKLKINAIGDVLYEGVVSEVSRASTIQERWNRGLVNFRVRVKIKDKIPNLYPGMTAMIDIIPDQKTNVLILGHEFVGQDKGQYFVTLDDGQKREIRVGLRDEISFEVVEGLENGQKVKQIDFAAVSKKGRKY